LIASRSPGPNRYDVFGVAGSGGRSLPGEQQDKNGKPIINQAERTYLFMLPIPFRKPHLQLGNIT
jgi:hypothetical protein